MIHALLVLLIIPFRKYSLTSLKPSIIQVCWESKCEVICINCGCSSHLQCLTKWLEKKQSSYLSYGKSPSGGCPVCRKKININIKIDTNRVCNDQVDDESPVQSPWPAERGCILIRWITRLLTWYTSIHSLTEYLTYLFT